MEVSKNKTFQVFRDVNCKIYKKIDSEFKLNFI